MKKRRWIIPQSQSQFQPHPKALLPLLCPFGVVGQNLVLDLMLNKSSFVGWFSLLGRAAKAMSCLPN